MFSVSTTSCKHEFQMTTLGTGQWTVDIGHCSKTEYFAHSTQKSLLSTKRKHRFHCTKHTHGPHSNSPVDCAVWGSLQHLFIITSLKIMCGRRAHLRHQLLNNKNFSQRLIKIIITSILSNVNRLHDCLINCFVDGSTLWTNVHFCTEILITGCSVWWSMMQLKTFHGQWM